MKFKTKQGSRCYFPFTANRSHARAHTDICPFDFTEIICL